MGSSHGHKKPHMRALLFGLVSVGLYGALLTQQDFLNATFGKGGMFAFLPILTAFVFSYVHGTFTGDFWTVMGVEAAKKTKGGK